MLTTEEQKRISFIEQGFDNRNKWSKQDYSDFYFRDTSFLLDVVRRETTQSVDSEYEKPECYYCIGKKFKWKDRYCNICGRRFRR